MNGIDENQDMLEDKVQVRLKTILHRMAHSLPVSLNERMFIKNLADQDQSVQGMVKTARRKQQKNGGTPDEIENLLHDLALGTSEPNNGTITEVDDLVDWFKGAPSWVTRS